MAGLRGRGCGIRMVSERSAGGHGWPGRECVRLTDRRECRPAWTPDLRHRFQELLSASANGLADELAAHRLVPGARLGAVRLGGGCLEQAGLQRDPRSGNRHAAHSERRRNQPVLCGGRRHGVRERRLEHGGPLFRSAPEASGPTSTIRTWRGASGWAPKCRSRIAGTWVWSTTRTSLRVSWPTAACCG